MLGTIQIIVLILVVLGGLPSVPWNTGRTWGYYPSGIGGLLLVLLVIWLALGHRI